MLAAAARELAAAYPYVAEMALAAAHEDASIVGSGCDDQFEFEFALDLLLDGFERLHERGWSSLTPRGVSTRAMSSFSRPISSASAALLAAVSVIQVRPRRTAYPFSTSTRLGRLEDAQVLGEVAERSARAGPSGSRTPPGAPRA
nr:hypothetical protein GCM10020092_072260 [Actinoplanes digitatis]